MEKQVHKLLEELEAIILNFKKAPSRRYLKQTLVSKGKRAREIYEDILYLVENFPQTQQKLLLSEARNLFSKIKITIDTRLDTATGHLIKLKTVTHLVIFFNSLYKKHKKMAVPKVDLKLGTSIIPIYDGNQEGLGAFIDSVRLFEDSVNTDFNTATADQKAAALATLIRFIKTRLTGKARAAVGDNSPTINDIIDKLKDKCGLATSPDVYISKLNHIKQTGDINKFTTEVENLTLLLER